MPDAIRILILDDHQPTIDGYIAKLSNATDLQIAGSINYGEELEAALAGCPVDVLILDMGVPISRTNSAYYPVMHLIPRLVDRYPQMAILVISMHKEGGLISTVLESGSNGYMLKDDREGYMALADVIRSIARGDFYISPKAEERLIRYKDESPSQMLSTRQLEALSLCAAYPNAKTSAIAHRMQVANSTVRNLLSGAYIKLGVRNRAAAVVKARQLGLMIIDEQSTDLPLLGLNDE